MSPLDEAPPREGTDFFGRLAALLRVLTPAQSAALVFIAASLVSTGVFAAVGGPKLLFAALAAGAALAAAAVCLFRARSPVFAYGLIFLLAFSYTHLRSIPPDLPYGKNVDAVLQLTSYPSVRGGTVRFTARVNKAGGSGRQRTVPSARVVADFPVTGSLQRGDRISARGMFLAPPDDNGYGAYLRSSGIGAVFEGQSKPELLRRPHAAAPISLSNRMMAYIRRVNNNLLPPVQGAFATALLTGDRSGIPDEVSVAFQRSGTMHILAISGLHVGFITVFLYFLLRMARVRKYVSFVIAAAVLVLFMVFIGNRASVRRASLMALFGIACFLFDRDRNYLNVLALAFCALWLANPQYLANPGFLLSFLATFGILLLVPRWHPVLGRYLPGFLAGSLAASLAVQVFIFPVLAAHFGEFAYVNIAANVVVVPLAGVSLVTEILTLASYPVFLPLAVVLAEANTAVIAALVWSARFFALAPPLRIPAFPQVLIPVYLAGVSLLCLLLMRPNAYANKAVD
jgi:ComEC/Rec2-related protein